VSDVAFNVHLAFTWFMTGLIWFVQLVHYPLMSMAEREGFAAFAARHQRQTTWVVGPAMLIELATAIVLLLQPFEASVRFWLWINLGLLALIWLSTAAIQMPCHFRLSAGFDALQHRRLVATNWLRTLLWSARAVLLSMVSVAMHT